MCVVQMLLFCLLEGPGSGGAPVAVSAPTRVRFSLLLQQSTTHFVASQYTYFLVITEIRNSSHRAENQGAVRLQDIRSFWWRTHCLASASFRRLHTPWLPAPSVSNDHHVALTTPFIFTSLLSDCKSPASLFYLKGLLWSQLEPSWIIQNKLAVLLSLTT